MRGTKAEIRQQMRQKRRGLSIAARDEAGQCTSAWLAELRPYRDAAAILAYVATENEVPTSQLIEQAWADGKRVHLPRVVGNDLEFALYRRGVGLRPGRFGIAEPAADAPARTALEIPTVAFVPLVAWDEAGTRLGRGGGFYDRAFATMRPQCVVGLGYAFQRHDALPCDPWDVKLDYVVTEQGVLYCGKGQDRSPVRKEDVTFNDICVDRVDRYRPGRRPGRGHGRPTTPAD
jgi:5-formyltetrahydrofolate cyclo-ligase